MEKYLNKAGLEQYHELIQAQIDEIEEVAAAALNDLESRKVDAVSSATNGNFAGLDADGKLTDSGSKASDFATATQGAKADTAYQKPSGGIPATDIASGVIPNVSNFITNSVNNLTNYYLKTETYTQNEIQQLIGAIQHFHYEIAASTNAVTSPQSNVLYLIGPTGSGADKYEEYVYPNSTTGFVKIGDTSIDLSGYVTTTALSTALADYTTTANLTTLLAGKQDTIDANNLLSSDLVQYESEGETIYVDLGLPSGTLWATMNVGAESETDYGNYYMYGKGANQYNSSDTPYSGTEDPLDASVDTARQVWGGSWHMPTRAQMQELTANTTYQWVTNYKGSGINGGTFTATNGAVLFFPATGYYTNGSLIKVVTHGRVWSSTPKGESGAYSLYFSDGSEGVIGLNRNGGYSVRGVIDSAPSGSSMTLTEKIEDIEDSLEGKADLVSGKVPASQLPSYVDDVIEGYYKAADGKFYESKSGSTYSTEITAETGKIYVDLDSNKTFRWSGSAYIEISSGPDIMGASGSNHKSGLVPDTPSTAGTNKYLREDAQWVAQATTSDVSTLEPPTGEIDPQNWQAEIGNKEDKLKTVAVQSGTTALSAEMMKYYTLTSVGTLTVTLPVPTGSVVRGTMFFIQAGSNPYVDFVSTANVYKSSGFQIIANKTYEVNAVWNGIGWVITQVELEADV